MAANKTNQNKAAKSAPIHLVCLKLLFQLALPVCFCCWLSPVRALGAQSGELDAYPTDLSSFTNNNNNNTLAGDGYDEAAGLPHQHQHGQDLAPDYPFTEQTGPSQLQHHLQYHNNDTDSGATQVVPIGDELDITAGQEQDLQDQDLPDNRDVDEKNKDILRPDLAAGACKLSRGCERRDRLNNTYLNHCSRHKLENLLSNEILMLIMHETPGECERILGEFVRLDELIDQFYQMFKILLSRYNCLNGYSVKWNCDDCKRAYKDWLCATNLPYYMNGERIKPCISFCERVEQRCPYLHPITKEQYGGQPVFICKDPNIPFVREITPDILYSEANKCYDLCHLNVDPLELKQDSLSKYKREQCPPNSVLAEQVRSDPHYCQLQPDLVHNETTDATPLDVTSGDNNNNNNERQVHAHNKKLAELREVLASYENQPKTHKFGHYSEHSSLSPGAGSERMSHQHQHHQHQLRALKK